MGCNYRLRGDRHEQGKAPGGQEEVGTEQGSEEPLCPGDGAPGRLVGCPGTCRAGAVSEGRGAGEKEQMMDVWTPGWAVRGTS